MIVIEMPAYHRAHTGQRPDVSAICRQMSAPFHHRDDQGNGNLEIPQKPNENGFFEWSR